MRTRSLTHAATWVLVTLTVTACTSSPSPTPQTSPTQRPTASTSVPTSAASEPTTTGEAEHDAITAYLGMWQAMANAATTSDWRDPALSRYATGDALQVITRSLYTDHRNGVVTKGAPKNDPRVSAAKPASDPTTIIIADCGDSTEWLKYRTDNGKPADDDPGGLRAITAEVKKQADGSWKVTRFAVEVLGSC